MHLGGENDIQSFAWMPETRPSDVLHFNHTSNAGLLPDSLWEQGRSNFNKETYNSRMEQARPLLLKILARLWCKCVRSRSAPHAYDKGTISGLAWTIPECKSFYHHGKQAWRGPGHWSCRLIHQEAGRPHGNGRGSGYLQARGIHQNPIHGERSSNHKLNTTKDFLLRPLKPMQEVSQIRTPCSCLQHEQNQPSRKINATQPSPECKHRGGSGPTRRSSRHGPRK